MSDPDIENNSPDTGRANVAERPEETFAAMLERTAMYERLSPGQKVTAKVVSISGDTVYIDLGGKSEGVLDRAEFVDEEGVSHINQGATVEAFLWRFRMDS